MAKYKVVATGPVRMERVIRNWLRVDPARIISIANVPFMDIPEVGTAHGLGRSGTDVCVRQELTMDDFEVEIIKP